jgi:hypothetical protein
MPLDYSDIPKSSSLAHLMEHKDGLDGTKTHPKDENQ